MDEGLPDAPVHDLRVHEREKDLIVGTHGRSLFRADVSHIQAMTPELREKPLHLFAVDSLRHSDDWGTRDAVWAEADTPSVALPYYSAEEGSVTARITAETEDGDTLTLRTFTHEAEAGLNYASYDLTVDAGAAERYNEFLRQAAADDEEDGGEPTLIEAADNEKHYLIPGSYTLTLERGDATVRTPLVIEASGGGAPAAPKAVPGPTEEQETK
jgi:hypothetical protein